MKLSDFHYDLPPELIAQQPLPERAASRLLVMDRETGKCRDRYFRELPDLLRPGDLLVFNDTRVIPARLFGRKSSGGRVEILVERILDDETALAQLRVSKKPAAGSRIEVDGDGVLEVLSRDDDFWRLRRVQGPAWLELLESAGHMPLPPYIRRADTVEDRARYQTVFAQRPGAVAAPTASLHFDETVLAKLEARGIERTFCTLHVGAGTFQPVRVDEVEKHRMHPEWIEVGEDVVNAVNATRAGGGRVIAVGTTAVRSLETAASNGRLEPYRGDSRLFIYPGYRFRAVDAMITNFHLPESTLLMLVSAFAGREPVLAAYAHAIEENYRFFSYGDAMLIR